MKTLGLALALTLFGSTALGASPDPGPTRSQFYIFEGSSFEVGARGPQADLYGPRQTARFGRLLELKKDLTPGIGRSLKERTFK